MDSANQYARLRVSDEVLEFAVRVGRVERNEDRPDAERRKVQGYRFYTLLYLRYDSIPRFNASPREVPCDAPDKRVKLAVRDTPAVIALESRFRHRAAGAFQDDAVEIQGPLLASLESSIHFPAPDYHGRDRPPVPRSLCRRWRLWRPARRHARHRRRRRDRTCPAHPLRSFRTAP